MIADFPKTYRVDTAGIYKLYGGKTPIQDILAYVMPDVEPELDSSKMFAQYTLSTPRLDRDNDIVVTKGIDLSDHRLNPVVLWSHEKFLKVGYSEDPATHEYLVKHIGDSKLVGGVYFDQKTKLGQHCYHLAKERSIRGASIGFKPVPEMISKGARGETVYGGCSLVEWSILNVPSHPDCVLEYVRKGIGSETPCPEIVNFFRDYIVEKESVVSGFDSSVVTKAMKPDEPYETDDNAPQPEDDLQDVNPEDIENEAEGFDDGDEASAVEMKPFAQMMHSLNDGVDSLEFMIDEALSVTEHHTAPKVADKIKALLGKVKAIIAAHYAEYQAAHPDQPDLAISAVNQPGDALEDDSLENPDADEDIDDPSTNDDDSDGTPDAVDRDPDGDGDVDNPDAIGGDSDEIGAPKSRKPRDKKAYTPKALAAWVAYSRDCFNAHWEGYKEGIKKKALAEAGEIIAVTNAERLKVKEIGNWLAAIAKNKDLPKQTRIDAAYKLKELRESNIVVKSAPAVITKTAAIEVSEEPEIPDHIIESLTEKLTSLNAKIEGQKLAIYRLTGR